MPGAFVLYPHGKDVEGTSHRGEGQLGSPQAALHLYGAGHLVEAEPVGPVHPAVLHIIDGDAIDHDRYVALVETTYGDAGIAITAALLGGIHPRCGVEDHGDVLTRQLFLDLCRLHIGKSYGGLACPCHVGHHLHLADGRGRQGNVQRYRLVPNGHRDLLWLISHIGDAQRMFSLWQSDGKTAVLVGHRTGVLPREDIGPDEGLSRGAVGDRSFYDPCLGQKEKRKEKQERKNKDFLPSAWKFSVFHGISILRGSS